MGTNGAPRDMPSPADHCLSTNASRLVYDVTHQQQFTRLAKAVTRLVGTFSLGARFESGLRT
jgi:hypothetical protein